MRPGITSIGGILRRRRLELGRSQSEVACALEVTQSSISNWEAGRTEPPLHLFIRICEELDLSPVQVVGELVSRRQVAL